MSNFFFVEYAKKYDFRPDMDGLVTKLHFLVTKVEILQIV
jgi:hypothetical protein